MSELTFREGRASDLQAVFELGEEAWDVSRRARGLLSREQSRTEEELGEDWRRERPLIEFLAAQEGGCFLVCEDDDELVGYVLMAHFGSMDEMAELWVAPSHVGRGVSTGLLERCWPESPTPDLGRLVVAVGTPADLTLFTKFGVMPVSGHWHMRHRVEQYLEQRALELDAAEPDVHVLTSERAVEEWKRLEPEAIGHERPALHEFFGRTRNCLATVNRGVRTRHGSLLGEQPGGDRAGGGRASRGPDPGGAGCARPCRKDAGAGDLRRLHHNGVVVADQPAARARVQDLLARLDHVVGSATGPRPLPGDPPRKIAVSSA